MSNPIQELRRRLILALFSCPLTLIDESWAQGKVKKVGILGIADHAEVHKFLEPFYRRLEELGWVEGRNVAFEFRSAGGNARRFAEPLSELIQLRVDVLFALGPPAVRAAFAATGEIPIVAYDLETDPVAAGYAKTYARPGGRLTGLFQDTPDLADKWIELLKSVVPKLSRAVVFWDPTSGSVPLEAVQRVAPSIGVKLQVIHLRTAEDIEDAPSLFQGRPQAVVVLPSPLTFAFSARIAKLVEQQRLPAASMLVSFAEAGGLLAYGPEMASTAERSADLVAKVLGGANPGDLPIERPTRFELVVNLKAAKLLGVVVPDGILARADRVIK